MMRRLLLAAALLTGTALPALAQTEPTFRAEDVRAHVEFLADDALEGRNAGERGYEVAARYVASRFRAFGLKPGNGEDWYQRVPFVRTQLKTGAPAAVTIGGTRFENGMDVLMGSSAKFPDQSVTAEVVFVGWGIDSPENGFRDYAGLDVRGKIVAYLPGVPNGANTEVLAHLASERGKMADAHGAIGTIQLHTPTAERLISWERRRGYSGTPVMRWVNVAGEPYAPAPGIQTSAYLGPRATEALLAAARRPSAPIFAEAVKMNGKPKGFAIPAKLTIERHSQLEKVSSPNVLAVLPGSDPALANEVVVLMAHLDHDGVIEKTPGTDKIMNGAMDNAAGTATMLEVARAFAQGGARPKRTILFAAVTAEEDGLLGAEYLAKNPVTGAGKVVAVVNLDMPLLTYDFTDINAFGAEHSTLGPVVAAAAAKAGVTVSADPMPEESVFTRSDHYKFVVEGVPSVFLATGWGGPGKDKWADFLKNRYHQVTDQADETFDWNAGAKFARINYLIARDIADAPAAPRWYQGNFFGSTFAKDAPKAARPK